MESAAGIDGDALNRLVKERLSAVSRFAGSVVHDLGNTVLPSDDEDGGVEAGARARSWRRQRDMLADHIALIHRALNLWRSDPEKGEPVDVDEWWLLHSRMLASMFAGRVAVRLEAPGDEGAPHVKPTIFTGVLSCLFIAVDLQRPQTEEIRLAIREEDRMLCIEARIEPAGSECAAFLVPDALQELLERVRGELTLHADGRAVIRLPA